MITAAYRFVVLFLLVLILFLLCSVSAAVLDQHGVDMILLVVKISMGIALASFLGLCLVLLILGRSEDRDLDDKTDP